MTPVRIRTSLSRAPKQAASKEELFEMRRKAWVREGKPSFDLGDIFDDWTRQVIINTANKLYGPSKVVK